MPKNKGLGGKKFRKGKKGKGNSPVDQKIIYACPDEVYGIALKAAGDRRFTVECTDGKTRLCHIRGKMRKRCWVNVDDLVLVSLREFQSDKADIVHKYDPQQALQLKKESLLVSLNKDVNIKIDGDNEDDSDDSECGIVFEDI